jgi:glycosyltransferase involved in cell wall biosynthesis
MKVLFVHQEPPGQYTHLARALIEGGWEVALIGNSLARERVTRLFGDTCAARWYEMPGLIANPHRSPGEVCAAHRSLSVARGYAAAQQAERLRDDGFVPDLIFAHPYWGEATYLKDVFERSWMEVYCEFFAPPTGIEFDSEFNPRQFPEVMAVFNAPIVASLEAADIGVSPTRWQAGSFPSKLKGKIRIVHDGVDTDLLLPMAEREEELITYVARNLEPYRGFHKFMRAIPEIQRLRPSARIVIVGGDRVSYSAPLTNGETYRQRMLRELDGKLDLARVSFIGTIPYQDYVSLLRRSAVHVYLTYPYVLSWSMLEAMALGCIVVGSSTAPVQEVIEHGVNGFLVDFHDTAGLAKTVADVLQRQNELRHIRAAARQTIVDRYDAKRVCVPAHLALLKEFGLT